MPKSPILIAWPVLNLVHLPPEDALLIKLIIVCYSGNMNSYFSFLTTVTCVITISRKLTPTDPNLKICIFHVQTPSTQIVISYTVKCVIKNYDAKYKKRSFLSSLDKNG